MGDGDVILVGLVKIMGEELRSILHMGNRVMPCSVCGYFGQGFFFSHGRRGNGVFWGLVHVYMLLVG